MTKAWQSGVLEQRHAPMPGTPQGLQEKEDSHVFNMYKGKERIVPNSRAYSVQFMWWGWEGRSGGH